MVMIAKSDVTREINEWREKEMRMTSLERKMSAGMKNISGTYLAFSNASRRIRRKGNGRSLVNHSIIRDSERESMSSSWSQLPPANSTTINDYDNDDRVILLLDLDCFYAQAACVRLGFTASETSLAVFQWNSVLAVTYPARKKYNIQRGDSWDVVRQKSAGQCLGVHVPILTIANGEGEAAATASSSSAALSSSSSVAPSSLQDEYDALFSLSPTEQEAAQKAELGVRRLSSQGKACIECFRIASARIFDTVKQYLQENTFLTQRVILERASIDEFFLDVTGAVSDDDDHSADEQLQHDVIDEVMKETVEIGINNDAVAADQ